MSDLDPFVIALFGPPPPDVDLTESTETRNDIITAVFLACAILSVLARWFSRRVSRVPLRADDYAIFVALILCIATAIVNFMFGPAGSGHHVWTLTKDIMTGGFKLSFVYTLIWVLSVSVTKLSIVLLYRRIFAVQKSRFRIWLDFLSGILICQTIAVTVGDLTVCRPLNYLWNRLDPNAHGTCFNQTIFLLASGIINACLDIIILVTPIPSIFNLTLSTKKKMGICGMMLLGCLVCIASWIRVYYLSQGPSTRDPTWLSGETATWSSIETSLGIVSACLPVMRPFYLKARDNFSSYALSETRSASRPSKKTYGSSTGKSRSEGQIKGPGLRLGPLRNDAGQEQSDDAINLTNIISGGPSDGHIGADRIFVQSEVRQGHDYV